MSVRAVSPPIPGRTLSPKDKRRQGIGKNHSPETGHFVRARQLGLQRFFPGDRRRANSMAAPAEFGGLRLCGQRAWSQSGWGRSGWPWINFGAGVIQSASED